MGSFIPGRACHRNSGNLAAVSVHPEASGDNLAAAFDHSDRFLRTVFHLHVHHRGRSSAVFDHHDNPETVDGFLLGPPLRKRGLEPAVARSRIRVCRTLLGPLLWEGS